MPRFFCSKITPAFKIKSNKFKMSSNDIGSLSKINLNHSTADDEQIITSFKLMLRADMLYLLTMPTQRLSGDFPDMVFPGHNASFMTCSGADIIGAMSKRPLNNVLAERSRVPDARFEKASQKVRVLQARFTSIEDELIFWVARARIVKNYSLYLHELPLALHQSTYLSNVERIISINAPYTLFSSVSKAGNFISASNCNTAVEESLFGPDSIISLHDKFCQEASICITERLGASSSEDYAKIITAFELNKDIEATPFDCDDYRSPSL